MLRVSREEIRPVGRAGSQMKLDGVHLGVGVGLRLAIAFPTIGSSHQRLETYGERTSRETECESYM